MARQVKRFGEHSQRWQKEAKAQGITAAKWNKWRRLSSKSRKASNPTDYAKGKSLPEFRVEKKRQAVFDSLNTVHKDKPKFRPRAVRFNVSQMTTAELDKVLSFKSTSALGAYITKKIREARASGTSTVYFYQ